MPLHDFRCPQGHVHEERVSSTTEFVLCDQCDATAERVFLVMPAFDYGRMAMGDGCETAIARFEKQHKDQRAKEEKSMREHGDYGVRPGSDGGRG